jgi:glutamate synthase (NADPH/NADH) large chain
MIHRGAEGADTATGDGAGIMIQVPHEFILLQGISVPEKDSYGTGLVFMPKDEKRISEIIRTIEQSAEAEGLSMFAVRDVPTDNSMLGTGTLNMIYKGMLSSAQLRHYFLDLQNPNLQGVSVRHYAKKAVC